MKKHFPLFILIFFYLLPIIHAQTEPEVDSKIIIQKGVKLHEEEKYEEALDLYEKVYKMDPLSEIAGKAVERYNALVQ